MKKKYIAALAVILVVVAVVAGVLVYASIGFVPVLSAAMNGQKGTTLVAGSDSMAPAIKKGAYILCDDTVPFSSLKVDDIIVFHGQDDNAGQNIVARIIKQDGDAYQVKGDANADPYPWNVTQDKYVGKIVRIDNP